MLKQKKDLKVGKYLKHLFQLFKRLNFDCTNFIRVQTNFKAQPQ